MEKNQIYIEYKKKIFLLRKIKIRDINNKYVDALKQNKFLASIPTNIDLKRQKEIVKKINNSKNRMLIGFFNKNNLIGTSGFQNLNRKKLDIGIFLFNKNFTGKGLAKIFIWYAGFYMYHFYKKKYFIAGIVKSNYKSLKAFKGAGYKLLNKKKGGYNYFLEIENHNPNFTKNIKLY